MKLLSFGLLAVLLSIPGVASASIMTTDPSLPPTSGAYRTAADVHADYSAPGLLISLSNILHFNFTGILRVPIGPDERENFGSTVTGNISVNGSPQQPFTLTGPVDVIVHNKVGNTTGTFDTEMIALSLTGITPFGPAMVRESPTLPSTGKTTVSDMGGGLFRIDSFFDVFTELSIDGGQTFIPSNNGPAHVELVPVPEPSSLALLGFGLAALGIRSARRLTRRP